MPQSLPYHVVNPRQYNNYRPFCFHLFSGNSFYAPAGLYVLQELYPRQQSLPRYHMLLRVFSEDTQHQATLELKIDPVSLQAEILLSPQHVQGPQARYLRRAVAAALFQQDNALWLRQMVLRAANTQSQRVPELKEPASAPDGVSQVGPHAEIQHLVLTLSHSEGSWPYRLLVPDHLSLSELQALLIHCPQALPQSGPHDRWRFFKRSQSYVSHSLLHSLNEHIWDNEANADQIRLAALLRRQGSRLDYSHHFHAPLSLRVQERFPAKTLLSSRCFWPEGERPPIEFQVLSSPQRVFHHATAY